jgi:hypothetical protein
MSRLLSFLSDNILEDTHIRLSGNRLTIRETDQGAKLKSIELVAHSGHALFAFVMDRRNLKICTLRSKKCQKTRDKCNALNSKICSFFKIKNYIHVGCDGIVITENDNEIIFYVCELKSKYTKGHIHKFNMAKALIMYLCEAARACDCLPHLPKIQFMLFRISPSGRKQTMRKPTACSIKKEDVTFAEYSFPENDIKFNRSITLSPDVNVLYSWNILCPT